MRFQLACVAMIGLFFHRFCFGPEPEGSSRPQLRGDRFKPLTYVEMTPQQKTLVDPTCCQVSVPRWTAPSTSPCCCSPEMGDLAQQLSAQVRFHSSLPRNLNEFVILITARSWNAQYEWYVHHQNALQAGLGPALIDAVASGKRPASMQPDEEAVYNFTTELLTTRQVSDATFAAAKAKFGERGVVDMIGVIGYYNLVSALLNVDRYPLPQGVKAELKPLH